LKTNVLIKQKEENTIFPKLETERLNLIEIGHEYTKNYYDIMSRDDVTKYYGMDSLKNEKEASKMIDSFHTTYKNKKGIRWGIILKENQEFIGTIGLNNLNLAGKKAEIGYEIHPTYWRSGITTEANKVVLAYSFEQLGLFRIGAVTFPDNNASSNLLKKLGFKEEGRLRGYLYQNNQSNDALVFSLLRTEEE
jgi:ribosomal-protein-alanine N-acetyltransferase